VILCPNEKAIDLDSEKPGVREQALRWTTGRLTPATTTRTDTTSHDRLTI
jgi:hypothetical protein